MTSVNKICQRGLVAAIMLPLILVFHSRTDAQPRIVNIPCGQDIDAKINADLKTTATRFVLGADCTFTASATIVPANGDEVVCSAPPTYSRRGPAFGPETRCTISGPNVANVFKPLGQGGGVATVHFEGVRITGGNFTGASGSGSGIAEGKMTSASTHVGIEVMNNEAAGIQSANGTFEKIELTNNTTNFSALGFNAAGLKARHEVEVSQSYVHDTQGNGLWCDNNCVDTSLGKFWVHHNLVVNAGRSGIRWEEVRSTGGEARIENNEVHGNSYAASRGGISARDAKDAVIDNNRFGAVTIAGVSYLKNANGVAITASDSARSDRPNLSNIDVVNNALNGETVEGCELPNTVVSCGGDTPWWAKILEHAYELLRNVLP